MYSELSYGIVDVDWEQMVTRSLRIPRIPCIGAVVNGRSVIFDMSSISIKSLRDFTRRLFPTDLLGRDEVKVIPYL